MVDLVSFYVHVSYGCCGLIDGKGLNGMLQPLFISVDPSRDTVAQLKHYSQDFHKDMIYLTGTKDQIAAIAKSFRVYFSKVIVI